MLKYDVKKMLKYLGKEKNILKSEKKLIYDDLRKSFKREGEKFRQNKVGKKRGTWTKKNCGSTVNS